MGFWLPSLTFRTQAFFHQSKWHRQCKCAALRNIGYPPTLSASQSRDLDGPFARFPAVTSFVLVKFEGEKLQTIFFCHLWNTICAINIFMTIRLRSTKWRKTFWFFILDFSAKSSSTKRIRWSSTLFFKSQPITIHPRSNRNGSSNNDKQPSGSLNRDAHFGLGFDSTNLIDEHNLRKEKSDTIICFGEMERNRMFRLICNYR